ncbi:PTS IIA-like nitrogen-regulatory protein PtsN [hydrothermal vent metagenome]|uniref:PTS IIA-like nitrogen-regulatory protein PtsN n=1 Tax=hydrothermal vent metagenome TaxID=652676 RepID=A0A3B0X527_9ZZZZ
MDISQLITPERVKCLDNISSKKRTLEVLSQLLASGAEGVDPTHVFHQLIERERLGSTGLGHGVALPHGRISPPENTIGDEAPSQPVTLGCFIKLEQGIDFDSPDSKPADLLFGLLVPKDCTDEHLQILAALAQMFSDTSLCEQLRHCSTNEALYAQLFDWAQTHKIAS